MPRLEEPETCTQCEIVPTYSLDKICAQCRYRNKRRLQGLAKSRLQAMKDDETRKEREITEKKKIRDGLIRAKDRWDAVVAEHATDTASIDDELVRLGLSRTVVEGLRFASVPNRPIPPPRTRGRGQNPPTRGRGRSQAQPPPNSVFAEQDVEIDMEDASPTASVGNLFQEVHIASPTIVPPPIVSGPRPSPAVQCTICQDVDPNRTNPWIRLECSHEFHASCLHDNTEAGHELCPNCRAPITTFQHFQR